MATEPWVKIRNEYVNGSMSYRELAEKYGISVDRIKKKASSERWREQRTKAAPILRQRVQEKVQEKIAEKEANRMARILSVSDRLMDQLERASAELDRLMVKSKRTVKTVEYKDSGAKGKPTKEIVTEREDLSVIDGLVDRRGLQQLSAALKNLMETQIPAAKETDEKANAIEFQFASMPEDVKKDDLME